MKKIEVLLAVVILAAVIVFFSGSAISVAQQKIDWDYFLLPEGTVKVFLLGSLETGRMGVGSSKDTYYQVKEQSDGKVVKVRTEMFGKDSTGLATFWNTFKLDENVNQVMEVETGSSFPGIPTRKYWDCPQIKLSLPLEVGKKWSFSLEPNELREEAYKMLGKNPPRLEKREVIGMKKLRVPAGEFNAYVIEIVQGEKYDVWGEGKTREYYAKGVGFLAKESTFKGKWMWMKKLEKIYKP
jgi:hypothetical protein